MLRVGFLGGHVWQFEGNLMEEGSNKSQGERVNGTRNRDVLRTETHHTSTAYVGVSRNEFEIKTSGGNHSARKASTSTRSQEPKIFYSSS